MTLSPVTMSDNDRNNNLSDEDKRRFQVQVGEPAMACAKVKRTKKTSFWRESFLCCCRRPKRNRISSEKGTIVAVETVECGKSVVLRVRPSPPVGISRKSIEQEDPVGLKHPVLGNGNGDLESPAFLPSIHHHSNQTDGVTPLGGGRLPPGQGKFGDVDEMKLQDTMTQLSGLLSNSRNGSKSITRDVYLVQTQPTDAQTIFNGLTDKYSEAGPIHDDDNNKSQSMVSGFVAKSHEVLPQSVVTSAPPDINTEPRGQTPSTSSSNSTDYGTDLRLRKLVNGSATDTLNRRPYKNANSVGTRAKSKKETVARGSSSKVSITSTSLPDNPKAFDRPKEGLDTCFNQLESQQWEVNMLGLTSLVRLLRHHPAVVLGQLHPIAVALGHQIKNLRSQVARTACQVSGEMFLSLKRNVESDLDELAGPLFHRCADTNRFIRADCNDALDNMVDSVGPAKAVSVIISKGTTHQNATVRTVAARLLLRLSERVGPEKLMSVPKETRDKMLQSGANLLTEGKLETRAFAKQVFRVWSSHPSFSTLMLESVPPNVMRNIGKILVSLKS